MGDLDDPFRLMMIAGILPHVSFLNYSEALNGNRNEGLRKVKGEKGVNGNINAHVTGNELGHDRVACFVV